MISKQTYRNINVWMGAISGVRKNRKDAGILSPTDSMLIKDAKGIKLQESIKWPLF